MNQIQIEIRELLDLLKNNYSDALKPASYEKVNNFKINAEQKGVNKEVIEQLADLYLVADNFMAEIIMGFHPCDDDIVFEWWNENELWIGQRDFNTLRWTNGKFCLGDAGSISYSKKDEYNTLIELIKGCIKEIKELEE
ncbi:hypothetical protein [Flavobacterium sp. 7A]|uniref:hypothetical protein n=1 Tax=Flavobacterium sp. 7A TaxID=2940571 RepID=UPI0022264DE7|nr:hypothetical protein [Flavobacterium sp. 7A]MCW2119923.1 hypothetical protein [Flavobacterium sp. 7A]